MNDRFTIKEFGKSIPLDAIRRYLDGHGWATVLQERAIRCVGPHDDDGKPIICYLPSHEESREFTLRVEDLLATLSAVEDRSAHQIAREILQQSELPASIN